jgi:diguanylate cyclase
MMADSSNPSEIAREALRRLAVSRVPPTPDNYRTYYHKIANIAEDDGFPERALKAIAAALPRNTPEAARHAQDFERAVGSSQWPQVRQAILALAQSTTEIRPAWASLIRDLVHQLGQQHEGLTPARKQDALEHVLEASNANPEMLHRRLMALVRSWAAAPPENRVAPVATATEIHEAAEQPESALRVGTPVLINLLSTLLQRAIPALMDEAPALATEARKLAEAIPGLNSAAALDAFAEHLGAFVHKLEWVGEDQRSIRTALQGLLRLVIRNISELVLDDRWLVGQLEILNEAFDGPLDVRVLDEVERRLRKVIDKQSQLKQGLSDAQSRLKAMLAGFVERLTEFSEATGEYHDSLGRCAEQIAAADDISQISEVVGQIMRDTRLAQETAARSREELEGLRDQVDKANREIGRLQKELDETSELVRHDPLTGTLNRKGLDEALEREIARARRRGSALCLGLLDIDNFKNLNDTYGHKAGDEALVHLAGVVRDSLRPQDSVGRLGGEEFIIILPDTETEGGVAVLARLQRELTRRFFLANNQKVLITFSAGVAELGQGEDHLSAVDRADKAMYAAKRAGKNRVFAA